MAFSAHEDDLVRSPQDLLHDFDSTDGQRRLALEEEVQGNGSPVKLEKHVPAKDPDVETLQKVRKKLADEEEAHVALGKELDSCKIKLEQCETKLKAAIATVIVEKNNRLELSTRMIALFESERAKTLELEQGKKKIAEAEASLADLQEHLKAEQQSRTKESDRSAALQQQVDTLQISLASERTRNADLQEKADAVQELLNIERQSNANLHAGLTLPQKSLSKKRARNTELEKVIEECNSQGVSSSQLVVVTRQTSPNSGVSPSERHVPGLVVMPEVAGSIKSDSASESATEPSRIDAISSEPPSKRLRRPNLESPETRIRGRFLDSDGKVQSIAWHQLPRETRELIHLLEDLPRLQIGWKVRTSATCVRTKSTDSKGYRAKDEFGGFEVSCRTCTNERHPCLRYINGDLYVFALAPCVRKGRTSSEPESWIREQASTPKIRGLWVKATLPVVGQSSEVSPSPAAQTSDAANAAVGE